jgi:hypothetical protein
MESETTEFTAEIAVERKEKALRSFVFYEEYSHKEIGETIRSRRVNFEIANDLTRMKIVSEVEAEVAGFGAWLQQSKGLEPIVAYYCSRSLKSLLLGIPTGVHIARLFDITLEKKF